jgi:hypothetical protein
MYIFGRKVAVVTREDTGNYSNAMLDNVVLTTNRRVPPGCSLFPSHGNWTCQSLIHSIEEKKG